LQFTVSSSFYYRLWHIVGFEITIIVGDTSLHLGGTLMAEKRREFDVVADILRVAALGSKESEIMVGCELDRKLLEKYMPAIVVLKLVSVKKESENRYRTTSRGLEFLRFYHGLRWLLWGKDFDYVLINILTKLKKDRHPYYVR
jgi:predicted transcriptional regulator